ncbi:hypothetical protein [Bacillus cereus]|uniref:hypothetical protein n=1 Tax=Bacillus cereus TaxID=1396 RepID=UPI0024BD4B07|nr:hypothetical protein [Bacillus cereus]WHT85436.1 hypothetical protein QM225_000803 [Bacillus cereus]
MFELAGAFGFSKTTIELILSAISAGMTFTAFATAIAGFGLSGFAVRVMWNYYKKGALEAAGLW